MSRHSKQLYVLYESLKQIIDSIEEHECLDKEAEKVNEPEAYIYKNLEKTKEFLKRIKCEKDTDPEEIERCEGKIQELTKCDKLLEDLVENLLARFDLSLKDLKELKKLVKEIKEIADALKSRSEMIEECIVDLREYEQDCYEEIIQLIIDPSYKRPEGKNISPSIFHHGPRNSEEFRNIFNEVLRLRRNDPEMKKLSLDEIIDVATKNVSENDERARNENRRGRNRRVDSNFKFQQCVPDPKSKVGFSMDIDGYKLYCPAGNIDIKERIKKELHEVNGIIQKISKSLN
jgi:hypothetical protein